MSWLGVNLGQINEFIDNVSKELNNLGLRTKGLGTTINQANKTGKSVEKTSENANSLIDMGKHTLVGGLIGGAISAMTGIGGLMPIGALIGLGIGYDFNKFSNGELPIQNNSKPKETDLFDLVKKYTAFRLSSFMGQSKKSDNTKRKKDNTLTLPDDFSEELTKNFFALPEKLLSTPNIIQDDKINDDVLNKALEQDNVWSEVKQMNPDGAKNTFKDFIKEIMLQKYAEKQKKEEND